MTIAQAITNAVPPRGAASSMAASPDWIHTYFRELAHHTEKARAAQAAGQTLPEIARRRLHDPAFAEEEAILLEAFADYLESEAIRRCCDRNYTESCKNPLGSDTLLIRLLNLFHPKFTGLRAIQQSLSRSAQSTNHRRSTTRPPLPDEEGKFKSRSDLVAFREWERHQAIALALDLLTQPPVAPAPVSSSLSCSCSCSPECTESLTPSKAAEQRSSPHTPCADPVDISHGASIATEDSITNSAVQTRRSGDRQVTAISPNAASPDAAPSIPSIESPCPTDSSAPTSPTDTARANLTQATALWSHVESLLTDFRAELKTLRRQGYSNNSHAVTDVTARIAECESVQAQLRPILSEAAAYLADPDPDPPP